MLLIYVLGGSCQRNIGLIFNLATIHEGVTPSNLPRYKMVNGSPNGNQPGKIDLCFNDKEYVFVKVKTKLLLSIEIISVRPSTSINFEFI